MPDTIVNGARGGAYKARVGTSSKLDVSARVNDRIYYAARDNGKAFIVQFELEQATGGATEGVGYIKYDGNDRINIKQIALTSEDAGMTKFGIWKQPTVSGGAVATPAATNFGLTTTSNTTCAEDADGTTVSITGGSSLYTVRLFGVESKIIPFYDAIIMGPNDVLGIKASASTTGSKVRVNIMFAESVD